MLPGSEKTSPCIPVSNLSHMSTHTGATMSSSPRSSGGSGFGGGGSSGGALAAAVREDFEGARKGFWLLAPLQRRRGI